MSRPMPILPKASSTTTTVNIAPKETKLKPKITAMNSDNLFNLFSQSNNPSTNGLVTSDLSGQFINSSNTSFKKLGDFANLQDILSLGALDIPATNASDSSSPFESYISTPGDITTPSLTPPSALLNSISQSPLFDNAAITEASASFALSALFPDMLSSCPSPTEAPSLGEVTVSSVGSASPQQNVYDAFSQNGTSTFGSDTVNIKPESTDSGSTLTAVSQALDAEVARKRRDSEFLASLPPQLALKRRRTGNNKHKDKILAEIMEKESESPSSTPKKASDKAPAAKKAKAAPKATIKKEPKESSKPEAPATEDKSKELDSTALKRQKNTDAARRSRMRKILRIETLESRVTDLETENISLNTQVKILENEKSASQKRESDLAERIRQLEKQIETFKQHPNPISFQNLFYE